MDQTSCFKPSYCIVWPWPLSLGQRYNQSSQCDKHLCQVISKSTHKWKLWTGQAVLSHLIKKRDLGPSHTQSPSSLHFVSYWWIFVSIYIKFLQLMKFLRTGQAFLSLLTLKCDLDLGQSHSVLAHCTLSYIGEYLCKVIIINFLQLMKK